MAKRSVRYGVRSRKLWNVGQSLDGWPKINFFEFLCASEGMLRRWSQLHLQSLALANPHWARVVGYSPFFLRVIHKEAWALAVGTFIGWWWWWIVRTQYYLTFNQRRTEFKIRRLLKCIRQKSSFPMSIYLNYVTVIVNEVYVGTKCIFIILKHVYSIQSWCDIANWVSRETIIIQIVISSSRSYKISRTVVYLRTDTVFISCTIILRLKTFRDWSRVSTK
jgi:hypothetical protein